MGKMKTAIIAFCMLVSMSLRAQDFWDIPTTEALISHNKTNYSDHQGFRDNQLVSQATVSFWKSTTNTFKRLSDSLDKRLTSLSILTTDVEVTYEIYTGLSEMYSYQSRSVGIATKYPFTLPVIISREQQIYEAGYGLFQYMTLLVLSYGDLSKMKASSRQVIFKSIRDQIFVLRAMCYSLYCAMERVDFAQLFKNTKEFQIVNKDASIVKDILTTLK